MQDMPSAGRFTEILSSDVIKKIVPCEHQENQAR